MISLEWGRKCGLIDKGGDWKLGDLGSASGSTGWVTVRQLQPPSVPQFPHF